MSDARSTNDAQANDSASPAWIHGVRGCCSLVDTRWPFPELLDLSSCSSCSFDVASFRTDLFEQEGIRVPDTIRRSVAKRQAEFLAGRLCARDALGRLAGHWHAPERNDDGSPNWPRGITGSITHCTGHAMAVVAKKRAWRSLGIDMERWIADESSPSLAKEILSPGEYKRFDRTIAGKDLALVFALKESLFKALHPLVRKRFFFQEAEVLEWHPTGSAQLRLLCDLSAEWRFGTHIAARFCTIEDRVLTLIAIPA